MTKQLSDLELARLYTFCSGDSAAYSLLRRLVSYGPPSDPAYAGEPRDELRPPVKLEDYGPVVDEIAPIRSEAWDALKPSADAPAFDPTVQCACGWRGATSKLWRIPNEPDSRLCPACQKEFRVATCKLSPDSSERT